MGDSIPRMSPSSSEGRRVRRFARGKMVGIASASAIVTLVWLFVACSPANVDPRTPSSWPGGTMNPQYLASCCAPADFAGGVVTDNPARTTGKVRTEATAATRPRTDQYQRPAPASASRSGPPIGRGRSWSGFGTEAQAPRCPPVVGGGATKGAASWTRLPAALACAIRRRPIARCQPSWPARRPARLRTPARHRRLTTSPPRGTAVAPAPEMRARCATADRASGPSRLRRWWWTHPAHRRTPTRPRLRRPGGSSRARARARRSSRRATTTSSAHRRRRLGSSGASPRWARTTAPSPSLRPLYPAVCVLRRVAGRAHLLAVHLRAIGQRLRRDDLRCSRSTAHAPLPRSTPGASAPPRRCAWTWGPARRRASGWRCNRSTRTAHASRAAAPPGAPRPHGPDHILLRAPALMRLDRVVFFGTKALGVSLRGEMAAQQREPPPGSPGEPPPEEPYNHKLVVSLGRKVLGRRGTPTRTVTISRAVRRSGAPALVDLRAHRQRPRGE